jgi:hypothetical protein
MDFEYFFFKPLSLGDFLENFNNRPENYPLDLLKDAYTQWIIGYCRKAQIFNQFQYRKHSDVTWSSFCQAYSIPDYEHPSSFNLEIEWQSWKEEYRLNSHYDEHQDIHQSLATLQETAQQKTDKKPSFFGEEVISDREIDIVWFNQTINNSPQKIEELKQLSLENYEKYRQTTHWKRTRAAILLISKAVCQAKECNTIGESWYGGSESEVEVHHLDYSNIGNERFNDLALLCRYHHGLLHDNLKNQGSIGIEII